MKSDKPLMSRSLRNDIASILMGISITSIAIQIWTFQSYVASRPRAPDQKLGFIYQMNNHGTYHYLTRLESVGLDTLFAIAFAGFVLAFSIVPKTMIIPPPDTPRWITYTSFRFETDLTRPARRLKLIFCTSIALSLLTILVAGQRIIAFFI